MNRIIKFRCWDAENQKMECSTGVPDFAFWKFCSYDSDCLATLMQFTGLVDKNGKEIYEGDMYQAGGLLPTVVVFEDGVFRGRGSQLEGLWYDLERYGPLTVIGNIYEDINLLENNK